MSGPRTWRGHDYRIHKDVEKPRAEWREEIAKLEARGGRTIKLDGDVGLMEGGRLIGEVYVKDT